MATPTYPIKLNGSAASGTGPSDWNVTTRAGKGSKINAVEHDNAVIALRDAANHLHTRTQTVEGLITPQRTAFNKDFASTAQATTGTATDVVMSPATTKGVIEAINPKVHTLASHSDTSGFSNANPLVAGTAAQGSSDRVSRQDHVHPAQTTITGNAATATTATNCSRSVIAGTGLTGGGALTANRTIDVAFASVAQAESGTATDVVMSPATTHHVITDTFEIHVPDPLRKSVEASTGGMCTVLYDTFGLPNYMRIIPAFNATDLGLILTDTTARLHPAFLVDGVAKPEIFIGMFQASNDGTGKAVSVPDANPWTSIDFDDARAACIAKGTGWHLMSNWEWAAIALWCMNNKIVPTGDVSNPADPFQPRGNTDYGRAHDATHETGTFISAGTLAPGSSSSPQYTLTGTGPYSWRHDGTPAGIADLIGNVWEWNDGMRIVAGNVEMPNDNNVALYTHVDDEASWTDQSFAVANANPWSTHTSVGDNDLLRLALISPGGAVHPQGRLYVTATNTRLPVRGGTRDSGANAGLAAIRLNYGRSLSSAQVGFRTSYISM